MLIIQGHPLYGGVAVGVGLTINIISLGGGASLGAITVNNQGYGYKTGDTPVRESPLMEKTTSKKSIIQRKNVDAKPARKPSKAARINMF